MDFWKEYKTRLKKAQFSQHIYDISEHLFSKMTVKNFLKMYPEVWAERINATQGYSYISEDEAIAIHKIATDLYSELLFDKKIEKKQKEYDELTNRLKKLQEQKLAEVKNIDKKEKDQNSSKWQLQGTIYSDQKPIQGINVNVFIENYLNESIFLGSTKTTANGNFKIYLPTTGWNWTKIEGYLNTSHVLLIKVFDINDNLLYVLKTEPKKYPVSNLKINLIAHPKDINYRTNLKPISKEELRFCYSSKEIEILELTIFNKVIKKFELNSSEDLKVELKLLNKAICIRNIDAALYYIEKILLLNDIDQRERDSVNKFRSSICKLQTCHFPENYYRYRFCVDCIKERELIEQLESDSSHWYDTTGPWINLSSARTEISEGHREFYLENFCYAITHYNNAKEFLIQIYEIQEYSRHKLLLYRSSVFIGPLIKRRINDNIFSLCDLTEKLWKNIFDKLPEPMTAPRFPGESYPYICMLNLSRISDGNENIDQIQHSDIYEPLEYGMKYVSNNFTYMIVLHLFLIDLAIAEANIESGNYDLGINSLIEIASNLFVNIPIEQQYIRCQLMRAFFLKAESHYRRGENEQAKCSYEEMFSIYKENGLKISILYGLNIENLDKEIINLTSWEQNDKNLFNNSTENPIVSRYLHDSARRLMQLKSNLNYLGYSENYIPIWSYSYLDIQARNLISIAQHHEAEYLNFIDSREKQHELIISLEQQYGLAKSELILSMEEKSYTRAVFDDLKRQYDSYGSASEHNTNTIFGAFNELNSMNHQKIEDDRTAEQIDRISSLISISASIFPTPAIGLNISPSGFVGLFTSDMRYSANKKVLSAQYNYEKIQLLIQKENILGQMNLSTVQLDIAAAKIKIAEYRLASLKDDLLYHRNKTFNEEFWWKAAQQAREFAIWYIEKANLLAFLSEQAYEYENDIKLDVIKFDYAKANFGEIYGAEHLLKDIDTIKLANIQAGKREVQVKHIVSLRKQQPFLLEFFKLKGNVGVTTQMSDLDILYPGLYKVQIKALEIKLIGLLPPNGITGSIRNIGHSLIRSKATRQSRGYLKLTENDDALLASTEFNYLRYGLPTIDWYQKTPYIVNAIDFEGIFHESPIEVYYFLYAIDVSSSEITIGGNKNGVNTQSRYPYFVIVPSDVNVEVSPESHAKVIKITKSQDGQYDRENLRVYSDRKVEIFMGGVTSESILNNAWMIQTNFADLNNSNYNLITLSLSKENDIISNSAPTTIFVAYDARSKSLPHWLCPYEIDSRVDLEETMLLSSFDVRSDGSILQSDTGKKGAFEGVGYGTRWQLDIPRTENKFDYSTIFDIQIIFYLKGYHDSALAERIKMARKRLFTNNEYDMRNIAFSLKIDFPDMYYHLKNDKKVATLKKSLTNIVGAGEAAFIFEINESHCHFTENDFICIDNEILRIEKVERNCITVTTTTSRGGIGTPYPSGSRIRTTYFDTQMGQHHADTEINALPIGYFDIQDSVFPHNEKGLNNDIDRTLWNISIYFSLKKELSYPSDYNDTSLQNLPIPIPFYLTYRDEIKKSPINHISNLLYATRKEETIGAPHNETTIIVPQNTKARLFSQEKHNEFFNQSTANNRLNPCANYGIVFRPPGELIMEDIEDIIINIEYSITSIF